MMAAAEERARAEAFDEEAVFLGTVAHVRPTTRADPQTVHLRPSYMLRSGGIWEKIETPQTLFPNRGIAVWYDAPFTAILATPWYFRVVIRQNFEPKNPARDKYRASTGTAPIELLEYRDSDQARRWLTEDGASLAFVPSEQVLLLTNQSYAIGPVHLTQREGGGWLIDAAKKDVPLPCVDRPPTNVWVRVSLGKPRNFLAPGAKPGPRTGQVDWAPDDVVLKRVLHWLRSVDHEYTDKMGLTIRAIDRALEKLKTLGIAQTVSLLDSQRLERAAAVVTALGRRQELLEAVSEDLLNLPAAAEIVRQAGERAATNKVRQIEEQMRAEAARVQELQQEALRLQTEITERRASLTRQVDDLDSSVMERLTEIAERPRSFLADTVILRAALSLGNGRQPAARLAQAHLPVFPLGTDANLPVMDEPKSVRQALLETGSRLRLEPAILRRIHVSLLSGALPVLYGSESIATLQAYASCVCAGRLLWLPVSPTFLDPLDLLGRVDGSTGRFVPHPARLLDLLIEAQGTDELYLVVLDGVNRGAVDTYLLPVLECYAPFDTVVPPRLPLAHPDVGNATDSYPWPASIAWPSNVLLTATLVEGPATVPFGPALWDYATLVDLEALYGATHDETKSDSFSIRGAAVPGARIPFSKWREWQRTVVDPSVKDAARELEASHVGDLKMRRKTQNLLTRVIAASRLCLNDILRITVDAIATCVIPQLVVRADTMQPDLSRLNTAQRQEVEAYVASAKRILA